jgi:hydroxylysine kinase
VGELDIQSGLVQHITTTLEQQYGMSGQLLRISTEKDDTFRLVTETGSVLVKVAAPDEGPDDIDLQVRAMRHLESYAPSIPVQRSVPSHDGSYYVSLENDARRSLRVLEFVEGRLLADVDATPALLADVGRVHGDMTVALTDFTHDRQKRSTPWDLHSLTALRSVVDDVETSARRSLATTVLDRFEEVVVPHLGTLERQVVHGDVSPFNVIIEREESSGVAGIIDFGDILNSAVIFDLSVPISNQLDAKAHHPWERTFPYLEGFLSRRPLASIELDLLSITAPARLLLRALLTVRRAGNDPERRDYLVTHGQHDWINLEAAWAATDHELTARIRETSQIDSADR